MTDTSKTAAGKAGEAHAKIDPEDELAGTEAPLMEHLIELRKRLIRSLMVLGVLLIVCFIFSGQIFDILLQPYRSVVPDPLALELIYTAPQEFFFTQLSLAFFGALFIGFPYLATQVYLFVAPGLYRHERAAFLPYLFATPVFFLIGTMLVYFLVLPMALGFFLNMETENISMLVRVSEYLGLAMTLIIAFGIAFQLPVVLTLLASIELLDSEGLKKGRRYAIVGIVAAAAFVTPPDPISQLGLAVPVYMLYEGSIWAVKWIERRRAARRAAEAAELES